MTNNVNEFGQILRASIGEDISTNIGLIFTIQPQNGITVERDETEGVTVGTSTVVVGDTVYTANEFLEYVVREDDLNQSGNWRKKATAKISTTEEKVGDFETFSVLP